MGAIITLTTDFGLQDAYVGMMRGALLSVNPDATVVDITHHLPPHDIPQAAYCIFDAYAYFPSGTVHVVVVDPGVGSDRGIVAMAAGGHFFLAPDNGVLSRFADLEPPPVCVDVRAERFFRASVSRTFHGRDIFAPVAAHLSKGVPLDLLGKEIPFERLVKLRLQAATLTDDGVLEGEIISIDRFGNMISNIHESLFQEYRRRNNAGVTPFRIRIGLSGSFSASCLSDSYQSSAVGAPLIILGSSKRVEIAVREGSAAEFFRAERGDSVRISFSID